MNKKAEIFNKNLKELNLENLQKQEIDDQVHTVIFRSNLDIKKTLLPMAIFVDDTIYVNVRIQLIAKLLTDKKKEQKVTEYLNQLNEKYKIFKFYINANKELLLDCCIPYLTVETFEPKLIRVIIEAAGQFLLTEYADVLKKIQA